LIVYRICFDCGKPYSGWVIDHCGISSDACNAFGCNCDVGCREKFNKNGTQEDNGIPERQFFNQLDLNADGFLSFDEVKQFSEKFTVEDFNSIDKDGTGQISLDNFLAL